MCFSINYMSKPIKEEWNKVEKILGLIINRSSALHTVCVCVGLRIALQKGLHKGLACFIDVKCLDTSGQGGMK